MGSGLASCHGEAARARELGRVVSPEDEPPSEDMELDRRLKLGIGVLELLRKGSGSDSEKSRSGSLCMHATPGSIFELECILSEIGVFCTGEGEGVNSGVNDSVIE